jgi:hypothetical protein
MWPTDNIVILSSTLVLGTVLCIFMLSWIMITVVEVFNTIPAMIQNTRNIEKFKNILAEATLLDDEYLHKKLDIIRIEEKISCEKILLISSWTRLKFAILLPKYAAIHFISWIVNIFKMIIILMESK